ncbi:glycoprotein endo-alpha-1,2-mannosidase-like [Watersipora subatra]|uniref:glycoprotein endo-alpha-1,2-mannosidase-like n=1 Tax=Watersipora subatra TaxID=2589382 RepID=UPI00355C9CB9
MSCLPRRISWRNLLVAVCIVILIIALFSLSSWKGKIGSEFDFPQNRKHPVEPATQEADQSEGNGIVEGNPDSEEKLVYDPSTWPSANYDVHVFYYAWYGNPTHDRQWFHWNHRYLSHWDKQTDLRHPKGRHKPPDDVGANFYPQLGAYSSKDPEVLDRHMYEIRKARIGVVAVSWYPPSTADDEGEPPDRLIPAILDAADKYDVKVCFHMEPFANRNAETIRDAIMHIINKYGDHNAFYRKKRGEKQLPFFYMYDSYTVKDNEWMKLLSRLESLTVRDTQYDGIFVGLAVESQHPEQIYNAGFDGVYTYFASDTFVFGSKPSNWRKISSFCKTRDMMFIPSVGPGYIDTEVRPWNSQNTKSRENGAYYKKNFKMALMTLPDIISITSFNEWHEGTQIEAAVPHARGYGTEKYMDYGGVGQASMYMELTRTLIESWSKTKYT